MLGTAVGAHARAVDRELEKPSFGFLQGSRKVGENGCGEVVRGYDESARRRAVVDDANEKYRSP